MDAARRVSHTARLQQRRALGLDDEARRGRVRRLSPSRRRRVAAALLPPRDELHVLRPLAALTRTRRWGSEGGRMQRLCEPGRAPRRATASGALALGIRDAPRPQTSPWPPRRGSARA
eukprot:Amastigsp_a679211_36.p6 type:complete len:118 gc:universal Amastigsp_a679211_36:751-398(-)